MDQHFQRLLLKGFADVILLRYFFINWSDGLSPRIASVYVMCVCVSYVWRRYPCARSRVRAPESVSVYVCVCVVCVCARARAARVCVGLHVQWSCNTEKLVAVRKDLEWKVSVPPVRSVCDQRVFYTLWYDPIVKGRSLGSSDLSPAKSDRSCHVR